MRFKSLTDEELEAVAEGFRRRIEHDREWSRGIIAQDPSRAVPPYHRFELEVLLEIAEKELNHRRYGHDYR